MKAFIVKIKEIIKKIVMKNKNTKLVTGLFIILLILVVISSVFAPNLKVSNIINIINDKIDNDNIVVTFGNLELVNNVDGEILEIRDGIALINNYSTCNILNIEKNVILETLNNSDDYCYYVSLAYGGYYLYKDPDAATIQLKRNGKLVAEITENSEKIIYQDPNDKDSEYIAVTPLSLYANSMTGEKGSNNLARITIETSEGYQTKVYNYYTGKVEKTIDGIITYFENPNGFSKNNYEIVLANNSSEYAINNVTYERVWGNNYDLLGDTASYDVGSPIYTNSLKYVVAEKADKYGVLDYEGNIIIPFAYEKITLQSNNNKYFATQKGDKYGLIDIDNKQILPFEYEAIEVYNNYIVTVKNNVLRLLDNKLVPLLDKEYELYPMEYDPRLSNMSQNAFVFDETKGGVIIYLITKENKNAESPSIPYDKIIIIKNKKLYDEINKDIYQMFPAIESFFNGTYYVIQTARDGNNVEYKILDSEFEEQCLFTINTKKSGSMYGNFEYINEEYIKINIGYFDDGEGSLSEEIYYLNIKTNKVYTKENFDNICKEKCPVFFLDTYHKYVTKTMDKTIDFYSSNKKLIFTIKNATEVKYLDNYYYLIKDLKNEYHLYYDNSKTSLK